MKRGIIIGVCTGVGGAAIIIGVIFLILNLTKFKPIEGGFVVPSNNYSKYSGSCGSDSAFDLLDRKNVDAQKWHSVELYKTDKYTDDGYPIYAWGTNYESYSGEISTSYLCRLGTNEDSAYPIDLLLNGKVIKKYSDATIVDKEGKTVESD